MILYILNKNYWIVTLWDLTSIFKNKLLRELTHQQLVKVFKDTGFKLSNHAIKRLKDQRLYNLGFRTPRDIQSIWEKGYYFDEGNGVAGYSYKGVELLFDKITKTIITIRPSKEDDNEINI